MDGWMLVCKSFTVQFSFNHAYIHSFYWAISQLNPFKGYSPCFWLSLDNLCLVQVFCCVPLFLICLLVLLIAYKYNKWGFMTSKWFQGLPLTWKIQKQETCSQPSWSRCEWLSQSEAWCQFSKLPDAGTKYEPVLSPDISCSSREALSQLSDQL